MSTLLMGLVATQSIAGADPKRETQEIAAEFMSPYCVGRVIRDCPSSKADELRNEIYSLLASGKTRADVEAILVQRFGPDLRAAPELKGFGLLAWLIPGVFLLAGAGGVGWYLSRMFKK